MAVTKGTFRGDTPLTTKGWILIFLALLLLCGGFMVWQSMADTGSTVTIVQDGETLYTIDLSKVKEPYELTIPYGKHYNIVRVSRETVVVSEADCGNQVCVNHGPLQPGGSPITCLPHHLIIAWTEGDIDA